MVKKSFPLRVLAISFIFLALPLLIYSFIFFQRSYFQSLMNERSNLQEVANLKAYSIAEILPVKQVLLKEIIYFLGLNQLDIESHADKISKELQILSEFAGPVEFFILGMPEDVLFPVLASSVPAMRGTSWKSYAQIQGLLKEGEGIFIRYVYQPKENRFLPMVFLAQALYNQGSEEPTAVLVGSYPIEKELEQILGRKKQSGLQYAMLDDDGVVFAAADPGLEGNYFSHLTTRRKKEIIETGKLGSVELAETTLPVIPGKEPAFFEFVFNDQVQIAYRAPVPKMSNFFLAYSSKKTLFVSAIRRFLIIYLTYGVVFVLGVGITYWLTRLISRPLRQLSYVMGKVSEGHFDVRFKKEPLGFEINSLGQVFNSTLDGLLANIQQAEDERVKKETYQKEIDIARKVQQALLPAKVPMVPGIEIASHYISAKAVGGDFYGYFAKKNEQSDDEIVITMVDAAGQGISSCLYALTIRSLIFTYAHLTDDLGMVLSEANNAFVEDVGDTGMFVTLLMGIYNTKTNFFRYYSCGHVPGIVRRTSGHIVMLAHAGMAMGVLPSTKYEPDTIELQKGDLILFYTDGLIHAVNRKNQHFSERRLQALLQQRKWQSAQEWVDGLSEELAEFTGGVSQEDDIAFLVMRIV